MAVTAATADHLLKELYPKKTSIITYQEHPLLAMLPKDTGFKGRVQVVDTLYAENQGRSATFSKAKNSGSHKGAAFKITTVEDYATAVIPRKLLKEATGAGAIVDLFQTEVDSTFRSISNSMANAAYGSGSGRLGQIATGGISGAIITLSEPNDVVNFDIGMVLVLSTADGGGTVKTGTITLVAVDRDAGTITASGNVTAGIATAAAGDYIFVDGDYDEKMSGLLAWLPSTAPGSTPFFGVDRSVEKTRLGGIRVDGSALNHEEALIKAMQRLGRERGPLIDAWFMHPDDIGALINILGTRKTYMDTEAETPDGTIGFRALLVQTGRGTVKVYEDADCPKGRTFGLRLDTWKLWSTGQAPEIFEDDGLKMLRVTDADSYEVRIGYYAQMACNAPGWNCNLKLSAV